MREYSDFALLVWFIIAVTTSLGIILFFLVGRVGVIFSIVMFFLFLGNAFYIKRIDERRSSNVMQNEGVEEYG